MSDIIKNVISLLIWAMMKFTLFLFFGGIVFILGFLIVVIPISFLTA